MIIEQNNYPFTLYELLVVNIQKENFSVTLTQEEIDYIHQLLMRYPETTKKINHLFDEMVIKRMFDLHDIPTIILVISEIYQSHIVDNEIKNINLFNLLQFTIDTILESQMIPLPELELKLIQKIVDSSMGLLKMNVNKEVQVIESCYDFFHRYSPFSW